MINEEKNNVRIYVINSNTGHLVRSETINTNEVLLELVERYYTNGSIVVASIDNNVYYFYIKGEHYAVIRNITPSNFELIELFKDVLGGLYDNARDAFHIQKGVVIGLFRGDLFKNVDGNSFDTLLNCIDDIWETRYYSRFLRRGKND